MSVLGFIGVKTSFSLFLCASYLLIYLTSCEAPKLPIVDTRPKYGETYEIRRSSGSLVLRGRPASMVRWLLVREVEAVVVAVWF